MATYRHRLEHHERRRAARIAPGLLTYASFGGSNGGMVLDVSERGLAIVAALAVPEASILKLAIAADSAHESMELTGRVAWMSESRRRLGIELVEEAGDARSAWVLWTACLLAQPGTAASERPAAVSTAPPPVPVAGKTPPLSVPAPTLVRNAVPDGGRWALVDTENAPQIEQVAPRVPLRAMEAESAPSGRTPVEGVPKRLLELVAGKESVVRAKPAQAGEAELEAADRADVPDAKGAKSAAAIPPGGRLSEASRAEESPAPTSLSEVMRCDETPQSELDAKSFNTGIASEDGSLDELVPPSTFVVAGHAKSRGLMEGSQPRYGRKWLALATTVVVLGSFGLGILIGRSVLGKAGQQIHGDSVAALPNAATNAAVSPKSDPSGAGMVHSRAAAETHEADSPEPTPRTTGGADATSRLTSETPPNGALPAATAADSIKDTGLRAPEADLAASGVELRVTPKQGDEPLRVALPAEVLMNTPSMEMVSQRLALVPGVKGRPHGKIREEKLIIGALLERVTPQPRPEALAAAGAPGSERVVSVRVTIEGDGHVSYVDPVSGPMTLMPSVMEAVREWKYGPSTLGNEPVPTEAELTVKFRPTPRFGK